MPYITPDQAAVRYSVCRRLFIPVEYLHIVAGAISELLMPRNWETRGDIDASQALEEMYQMWLSYGEGAGCMIGSLVDYVTTDPPEGVLFCDGTTYNRVDYPLLYASIDTLYIIDADTFQVPDLRGRARITSGSGSGLTSRSLGDTLGEETHTLIVAEMPGHFHTDTTTGVTAADPVAGVPLPAASVAAPSVTGSTGGDGAHENMQPSYVIHTGIVAR